MSLSKNLSDLKKQFPTWHSADIWILGKGPTLKYANYVLNKNSKVITLNHACKHWLPNIAYFTDLEAYLDCSEYLSTNPESVVVLPEIPHINSIPRDISISDLCHKVPSLKNLMNQGRLFSFQSSNTWNGKRTLEPVIELRYFSVEPAYQIACFLGAAKVRTLGIDGGKSYSSEMAKIAGKHRLSNNQKNFNKQWIQLNYLTKKFGVPMLQESEKNKVYVGVAERELIAFKVLEFSIHKHSTIPVQVLPLPPVNLVPKDKDKRPRTPFSFSRFLIPSLNGYKGKAVYLDSDMQVFSDIAELFNHPLGDCYVGVTKQETPEQWKDDPNFKSGRQFSVMLIDCEKSTWKIEEIVAKLDSGEMDYADLMYKLRIVPDALINDSVHPGWNSLEHYTPGHSRLTHFTVVPTQPWKFPASHLFDTWVKDYIEAIKAGYVDRNLVQKSVRRGHVHPDLLKIYDQNITPSSSVKNQIGTLVSIDGGLLTDLKFKLQAILRNLRWRFSKARKAS